MTLSELIAAFRLEADDTLSPYLWSDDEIVGYLNDAENEACIRAELLIDETTLQVARLTIVADTESITLSPLVLQVRAARTSAPPSASRDLLRISRKEMILMGGENSTPSTALCYAIDGGLLWFYPIQHDPVTLVLRVSRLPLEPLSIDRGDREPEIPKSEHLRLLDWALFRAFSKRDADTGDARRALGYLGRFEGYFGPRPSARARRQFREAAQHRVAFHGF